ncbi:hypothetical protein [Sphingomonas sp. ACRSK]|uniref:hypothetical protein n=1 Tax=Sphingomonas sp. ACRSK TaxID=2918213 RepID=UPI001EF3E5A9|nr:hypothetical protein [Sphingomonas sp. ACRSK]MCG7348864.1 hypothetical protein [Sphingomonas sp. ACRSK]
MSEQPETSAVEVIAADREAELLAFVLDCSAGNPAAIGSAVNQAALLLERYGIEPRESGVFYHTREADVADARHRLATQPAAAEGAGDEAYAQAQADHWLDDMQTPSLDAKHVSLKAMALNCIRHGRSLAAAPTQGAGELERLREENRRLRNARDDHFRNAKRLAGMLSGAYWNGIADEHALVGPQASAGGEMCAECGKGVGHFTHAPFDDSHHEFTRQRADAEDVERVVLAAKAVLEGADRRGSRVEYAIGDGGEIWHDYQEVPQAVLDELTAALAAMPRASQQGEDR